MKRVAIALTIVILFVAAYILFIRFNGATPSAEPQPAFTFLLSSSTPQFTSAKDQVFYVDQSGLFSYDIATGKTLQIAAINASTSVFNGRRIGGDTIGFEVGQAYSNETSSVYMFDVASDTLTREADVGGDAGWYVDNLEFVAPGEFAYTEASTTAGMVDNYDRVFLFKNGTTTQIGYISNPGEYGSTLSSAPDGRHLFFAGQIYNMAAGTWTPVTGTCKGPESAWLNNDVVVLKWESDYNAGGICYYDITSGAEGDVVGVMNGFDVMGGTILYMDTASTLPGLFQISQYDYATRTAQIIIPNARLWSYYHYNMDGFPGVVYQPMVSSGTCYTLDCFGGIASGSLMMFDPATGSSTSLGFGSLENITDIF
jgi:hypothetical protein